MPLWETSEGEQRLYLQLTHKLLVLCGSLGNSEALNGCAGDQLALQI